MKRYFLFISIISAIYAVIKMLFFTPDTIAKVMVIQKYENIVDVANFANRDTETNPRPIIGITNIPKSQLEQYNKLMSDPKHRQTAQEATIQLLNINYHETSGQQFQNTFRRLLAAPFDRNMNLAINLTRVEKYAPTSEKYINAHIELEDQWKNMMYIARISPQGNLADYKSFGAIMANGLYSFVESFIIGGLTCGIGTGVMLGMDIYTRPKINKIVQYVFDSNDFDLLKYGGNP